MCTGVQQCLEYHKQMALVEKTHKFEIITKGPGNYIKQLKSYMKSPKIQWIEQMVRREGR